MDHFSSETALVDIAQPRVIELLGKLAPAEGFTPSPLDGVRFMRVNQRCPRMPVLYEPCIVIVCQGRKRGFLGEQTFVYDSQHYLVMAVPLPFECETEATEQEPLLAVSIRVDLTVVAELLIALNDMRGPIDGEPRAFYATPLDRPLGDAVLRLLEALASPSDGQILGPGIVREICYRVLTGPQGDVIRVALTHQHHFGRIAKALRRIHSDYRNNLDVEMLAREAGMSSAAFHSHFKAVTATSPMQYVKATRLHHARLLMAQDGLNVSAAAAHVGYESASQFSREFKRLFGVSPVDEARRMRAATGPAPSPAPLRRQYVTAD
ncbi:AraC family transcriptional regulator [Trinickia sp. LjRoot230]|uniref:AraC family transcriptional regulator n=1 Tax=Trinickia sp. LjRoot230 TaxID=3342288 RepID=UPI003ECE824C